MPHVVMSLFAFVIASVSLWRIMADQEFYRLTMMKRVFGRRRGLAIHFIVTVAIPLVLGIVFLTSGITGKIMSHPLQSDQSYVEKADDSKTLPHDYLCFS